jgi:hypothetical protein
MGTQAAVVAQKSSAKSPNAFTIRVTLAKVPEGGEDDAEGQDERNAKKLRSQCSAELLERKKIDDGGDEHRNLSVGRVIAGAHTGDTKHAAARKAAREKEASEGTSEETQTLKEQ